MMTNVVDVDQLIHTLRQGLRDLTPGPEDTAFGEVWGLYTDIVHLCGYRLLEEEFGSLTDAANEVRMYLEHFEKVERIARVLPVKVPKVTHMRMLTLRNFLRDTPEREEIVSMLQASPTVIADLAEYVQRVGGRLGFVLYELLLLVGSTGSVFQAFLTRTIPESGE